MQVMLWPSLSPDLAPIERVWDELGQRVKNRAQRPVTLPQLRQALTQEWNAIPKRVIQNIITSMRRRCTACINAGGGHTRYWLLLLGVGWFTNMSCGIELPNWLLFHPVVSSIELFQIKMHTFIEILYCSEIIKGCITGAFLLELSIFPFFWYLHIENP